jgi:predicted amidohydrolase YtcJ
MISRTALATSILLAASLGACGKQPEAAAGPGPGADLIITGGKVLTMEGDTPTYAEAVVVDEGKIVFVGSAADAMKQKADATIVRDIAGKVLLPAFIDAHSHYINMLTAANQAKLYPPPAGPGKDVESILAELKRFAAERNVKPGEMIMGYGYDETVMPGGRQLTRDDLDKAFPNNPVRIDHVSMHGGVLNSAALAFYKVDPRMKTPEGGIIVRKPGTDEIGGLIMETAFLPIFEQTAPMTPEDEVANTKAAQREYAAAGITTAHEGATHLASLQTMHRAAQAGANFIDVTAYPFVTDLKKTLAEFPIEKWTKYDKGLKLAGVKITIDGSPQGRTAAFTTPYTVPGPNGEKGWKGQLFTSQDNITAGLKQVYALNVPVTFHANGDAAIDALITAHKAATAGETGKPRNVTAIHAQFIRPDQIAAFKALNIRPSFYTLHTFYFADAHIAQRGEKQAMFISPMRAAIDAGLHPTNHTDAVVAPLDQMFMLWSSVNRISRSGKVIGADQRSTAYEGLKAMTIWGAEQIDEGDSKGTVAVGKRADLVLLSADPTKVKPLDIKDIQILETFKDGKSIFTKP